MRISLDVNRDIWFGSDAHFHHKNICKATSNWNPNDLCRSYKSLSAMDEAIVKGYNIAKPEDIIVFLGDWSFGGFEYIQKFRDQIRCKYIYFILGNHDHHIDNDKNNIKLLFQEVVDYAEIEIDGQLFVCSHYPMASWRDMNRGSIHLHGHVHLHYPQCIHTGKAMDIGWDGWSTILHYKFIEEKLKDHPIKVLSLPKDHHETELR